MSETLPIVDMSAGDGASPADYGRFAADIGRAARDVGFFYLTGHGIDPRLMASVFAGARAFFALPEAEMEKQSIRRSPHNRGYVCPAREQPRCLGL